MKNRVRKRRPARRRYCRSPPQRGQWNCPWPVVRKNTRMPQMISKVAPEEGGFAPRSERADVVAGPAGGALHVLTGPGQRDDRDEEQGEEAPPGAAPVLPVAAAARAVELPLAGGAEEHPNAPDDQQGCS